jgi:MoaA/NifB/PqqE/SkfB family radical SAM enzyme
LHERQKRHDPGSLRTIAMDVTSRCNMTCSHCYAETFNKVDEMSLEVMKSAFDQFHQLGVFHYVFQGGEPTVSLKRLEFALRNCYPDETYINVVSNGWEMTQERIAWLRDLKVDKICFSMDSGIPADHDANRLPGSWAKVAQAVDDVLAAGLFTSVSTVVTHSNLHGEGFQKVLDFAKGKGIRVDVQIAEPVGKWDGIKEDLITPEDAAYLKSLQQNLGKTATGQAAIHRDIYCGDCDHCPAGTQFMALTANGNLLPCNFLQYTLGNVADDSIAAMRKDLLDSPWYDDSHGVCICGEDDQFIDSFITPFTDRPKPLDAYEVFKLPRGPRA